MDDKQMREAFEAAMRRLFGDDDFSRDREGCYVNRSWHDAYIGWQAAYAAGMERAEWICRLRAESCRRAESPIGAWHSDVCADAIRTDLPGANL